MLLLLLQGHTHTHTHPRQRRRRTLYISSSIWFGLKKKGKHVGGVDHVINFLNKWCGSHSATGWALIRLIFQEPLCNNLTLVRFFLLIAPTVAAVKNVTPVVDVVVVVPPWMLAWPPANPKESGEIGYGGPREYQSEMLCFPFCPVVYMSRCVDTREKREREREKPMQTAHQPWPTRAPHI